jgi:hypothetical protein
VETSKVPREAAAAKADLESLSPERPCWLVMQDAAQCLLREMENSSYHKSAPSDVSLPQQRWPGQHRAIAIALRHCEDSVAGLVKRCSRTGGVRREARGSTQIRRLRLCALR